MLLLLILPLISAEHIADTNYTIRHVDTCPDVGYFFKRDMPVNRVDQGPCFLCFCQDNNTAVCWRRENRRCDVESYHFHGVGKRNSRVRRGLQLGDVFFRDATRDMFSKGLPEQCKPYESSFSDGCPPADWCIGCTVCDCDVNGHWDCRVLSYCPEMTTQKSPKKRKGSHRTRINGIPIRKPKPKPPPKKPITKNPKKPATQKPIICPKRQPPKPGNSTPQITIPDTQEFTKEVIKKVMGVMQKFIRNDIKKGKKSRILGYINSVKKEEENLVDTKERKKRDVSGVEQDLDANKTTSIENTTEIESILAKENHTYKSELLNTLSSSYYTYYLTDNTVNDTITKTNNLTEVTSEITNKKLDNTTTSNIESKPRNESLETVDNILQNANDLKFNDWPQLKRYQTKKLFKLDLIKFRNFNDLANKTNSSAFVTKRKFNKKVIRKDKQRKNTVKTVLKDLNNKRPEAKFNNTTAIDKITKLQNKFKNILRQITSAATPKPTFKKYKFITQIKRLFNKIISRKTKSPNQKLKTFDIICHEFGPCILNKSQKRLVNLKLTQLNAEITSILRAIEIIKGLLKLINIPNKINDPTNKSNDLNKLDTIINGDIVDTTGYNLTQTEKTQIDYIKTNTRLFVKSIGKFAKILQDIIAILNKNKHKIHHANTISKTDKRATGKNKMINAFKDLIRKYNIMHNTFMKKLFNLLNRFENEPKILKQGVTEKNTKDNLNIIMSLKKLTDVESKSRSKRNVGRDDAVEYLLMVMEFLLKQNYRLDSVPVDDGIDLLLDAIKNAPDVKTIKKKVLEDVADVEFHSVDVDQPDNETSKSESNSKQEIDDKKLKIMAVDNPEINDDEDKDYDDKYIFRGQENTTVNDVICTTVTPQSTVKTESTVDSTTTEKEANIDDQKYDVYIADKDDRFNESADISMFQDIRNVTNEIDNVKQINIAELDWFGNDKELKYINEQKPIINVITTSEKPDSSTKPTEKPVETNISGLSKELKEDTKKTKEIEKIMVKKQMELLNSLDYETEKIFTDSSESKDNEKYPETNSELV